MRYSIAAAALALGPAAFAGNDGWGTQDNGYGFYHESNAGSTGWADASNGNGSHRESTALRP